MGTNFYAVRTRPTTEGPIHIGKSSIGWLFCFQTQNQKYSEPPVVWNTFEQVKAWLKKYTVETKEYVIIDEYDSIIYYDEFVEFVERKQNDKRCKENPDNFTYDRNVNGYRFADDEFS